MLFWWSVIAVVVQNQTFRGHYAGEYDYLPAMKLNGWKPKRMISKEQRGDERQHFNTTRQLTTLSL
jgi:hypothetical protein